MKNPIRKTASSLLAVCMLLMLFGCKGSSDQKKFEGTWTATIDGTKSMNESIMEGMGEDGQAFSEYFQISKFEFVLTFTFRDDGTYSMSADEARFRNSIDNMLVELKAGMTRYFDDMLAAEGFDMTVDEFLDAQVGMSLDEYLDQIMPASVFYSMASEFSASGKWKADGGKLYLSENMNDDVDNGKYDLYEFTSSDEIKLSVPPGETDPTGMYPIILKKSS